MRVWFLRAFVVFFLDFVMFWKSFHGCGLDMFLCSCFPNKPTFICLKQPLDPTLPFLAHKHSHCFKGSTFWASPSTFFMKWREDHYLETQCAHQAQQKLRNLLSSTAWLIGICFCMAFLTSIPIISLILILRVIGSHSASIGSSHPIPQVRLDQSCSSPLLSPNGSSGLCFISPHLRRNLPKNLMKPMEWSSLRYTEGLNWLCGHYSFPSSWRTFSSPQPSCPHIDIHEVRLYQTWHAQHAPNIHPTLPRTFSRCHPSSKPHWTSPTPTQK